MKRIALLLIFTSVVFTTVLAQQDSPDGVRVESGVWTNVAPPNAGFTVLMPAKPSEKVDSVEGHPDIENHLMTLETKLAGYVVSYVQFPDEVTDTEAIKGILDRGREGGIASTGGKIKSEKELKLNEYFGREWIMELPGGLLATARAYWVKRRLYQTVFVVALNASDPADVTKLRQEVATKFLDSFTLSEVGK